MELLKWHKVCELGGDKLHRPPVVALKMKLVAPMPEQIGTPTMFFCGGSRGPPETLEKCIVGVPIFSGMGAAKINF